MFAPPWPILICSKDLLMAFLDTSGSVVQGSELEVYTEVL